MSKKQKEKLFYVILFVVMVALAILIIVPLMIVILGSLKNSTEAQLFNLNLPSEWHFDNYVYVIQEGGLAQAFYNSTLITTTVTACVLIFGSMCAFIVSRRVTKTTSVIYNIFLLGMVAPLQIVTTFGLLQVLQISGTYFAVICIKIGLHLPWTVFTMYGFMKSVPVELDEAAIIDGANPIVLFFKIILPLLKPILATAVVTVAMGAWNEFTIPLYFFNSSSKWTMPLTVYNFFGQFSSDWNYVFADLVLTAAPIAALYLYMQRFIVEGATSGAVKG
ncbi:MAG: carbohydrate ABC transporter permease [Eubacteriales bacterium]